MSGVTPALVQESHGPVTREVTFLSGAAAGHLLLVYAVVRTRDPDLSIPGYTALGGTPQGIGETHDHWVPDQGGKAIASRIFYRWADGTSADDPYLHGTGSYALWASASEWSGLDTFIAYDEFLGAADQSPPGPWVYGLGPITPPAGPPTLFFGGVQPSLNASDTWNPGINSPSTAQNLAAYGTGGTGGSYWSDDAAPSSAPKTWVGYMAGPEAAGTPLTMVVHSSPVGGIDRGHADLSVMFQGPETSPPPPDDGIDPPAVYDPAGSLLVGLEDAYDVVIQIDRNGVGSGSFKINRYSAEATAANLKGGNIVKVTIPRIDADPIFAFIMEDEGVKLVSSDEEGGEFWEIKGRGALAYPERAVWLAESFSIPWWVSGTPSAGDIGQIEVEAGTHVRYIITGGIVTDKATFSVGAFTAFYDERKSYHFDPADGYPSTFTRLLVHLSSGPHAGWYLHLGDAGYTDHFHSTAFGDTILLTDISPDTPGAILYYLWTEATHGSRAIQPTPLWDVDFTATTDSNGDPWATTDALTGMTVDLGEDYLTTILKLIGTGAIDVEMGPDFVMHAWNAPSGRDLTGAFGAGVVRFEAGVNIADELARSLTAQPIPTWAQVLGSDNVLSSAYLGDWMTRIPREISIRADSSDPAVLTAIGQVELARMRDQSDSAKFNTDTALPDSEADGRYVPGRAGTDSGKYWVGDTVTLHSGTGEADFDEADEMVSSITLSEDEAGSLQVTVEVGSIPVSYSPVPRPAPTTGSRDDRPAPGTGGTGVHSTTEIPSTSPGGSEVDSVVDHSETVGRSAADQHPASAVTFTPTGTLAATDVQAAIAEAASEAIQKSLLTTQDDIIVRDGSGPARLGKGSDGQVLTVDPTTHHLVWATPSSSGSVAADAIWDAKGDLAVGTGADTAARLPVGTNDQILMAESAETTGLKWVSPGTPVTQAFGDVAAAGTSDDFARGGHVHGMPADPVTAHVAAGDPHTQYAELADDRAVAIVCDGAGSVVTTGVKAYFQMPNAGHFRGAKIIAKDASSSATFDVWKRSGAVPTVTQTITNTNKPTLTTAQLADPACTVASWDSSAVFAANDWIAVNLDSVTTATLLVLVLYYDWT